jgi:hypothetical protein
MDKATAAGVHPAFVESLRHESPHGRTCSSTFFALRLDALIAKIAGYFGIGLFIGHEAIQTKMSQ